MISLSVVVRNVFAHRPPQRAAAKDERCYMSNQYGPTTSAPHVITGASQGNGTAIIDPSAYSGSASNFFDAPVPQLFVQTASNAFDYPFHGSTGIGCIPSVAFDTIWGYAARAFALTLNSGINSAVDGEKASYLEVSGPAGPFQISGFSDGINGLKREIFNATQYQMTLKHEDSADEPYSPTPPNPPDQSPNRIYSPSASDVTCTVARLRYSSNYLPPSSSGASRKGVGSSSLTSRDRLREATLI
jgi:hypothetical protein